LIQEAKTEELKTVLQQCQTGLTVGTGPTGGERRSDRFATTLSGDFEAEDTRRDRMACFEATHGAVAEHPSDG
jgi:RNase adaptor protein for sRNA GlmZ degradation